MIKKYQNAAGPLPDTPFGGFRMGANGIPYFLTPQEIAEYNKVSDKEREELANSEIGKKSNKETNERNKAKLAAEAKRDELKKAERISHFMHDPDSTPTADYATRRYMQTGDAEEFKQNAKISAIAGGAGTAMAAAAATAPYWAPYVAHVGRVMFNPLAAKTTAGAIGATALDAAGAAYGLHENSQLLNKWRNGQFNWSDPALFGLNLMGATPYANAAYTGAKYVKGAAQSYKNKAMSYIWDNMQHNKSIRSAVDQIYMNHPEYNDIAPKSIYIDYVNGIYPDSKVRSVVAHGTFDDLNDGIRTTPIASGSGAPEVGAVNEMYFNANPSHSLQYTPNANPSNSPLVGSNWNKQYWTINEILGKPYTDFKYRDVPIKDLLPSRQSVPMRSGRLKPLQEYKDSFGMGDLSDIEFMEKLGFNPNLSLNQNMKIFEKSFDDIYKSGNTNGLYFMKVNSSNPMFEYGKYTNYGERGVWDAMRQNGNDALISAKARNEFGGDVVVMPNATNDNVWILGSNRDADAFRRYVDARNDVKHKLQGYFFTESEEDVLKQLSEYIGEENVGTINSFDDIKKIYDKIKDGEIKVNIPDFNHEAFVKNWNKYSPYLSRNKNNINHTYLMRIISDLPYIGKSDVEIPVDEDVLLFYKHDVWPRMKSKIEESDMSIDDSTLKELEQIFSNPTNYITFHQGYMPWSFGGHACGKT